MSSNTITLLEFITTFNKGYEMVRPKYTHIFRHDSFSHNLRHRSQIICDGNTTTTLNKISTTFLLKSFPFLIQKRQET